MEEYERLLRKHGLEDKDLDETITDLDMSEISLNINCDLKGMNAHLNMGHIVVTDIEAEFNTPAEKRQAYFQRWRREKGSDAKYKSIVVACLKCSNRKGAEEILKLCESSCTKISGAQFGQKTPTLCVSIQQILNRYPDGQIFKELIQNADDAMASKVTFYVDCRQHGFSSHVNSELMRYQGPALISTNDASFTDEDWKNIQKLQESSKAGDSYSIGRFGIGFNSVYHITDVPSIISGKHIGFFDPQEKIWKKESGRLFTIQELSNYDHLKVFNGIKEIVSIMTSTHYPQTIFRFPLRQASSDLSKNVYNIEKINKLIEAFRFEAKLLLIFLRSVHTIEVYNIDQCGNCTLTFQTKIASTDEVTKERKSFISEVKQIQNKAGSYSSEKIYSFSKFDVSVKNGSTEEPNTSKWAVENAVDFTNPGVKKASEELNVFPWVGAAVELGQIENGKFFCFLPIPTSEVSNLPVHINAMFGVDDARRLIKWPENGMENDSMANWNKSLVEHPIPSCYAQLLLDAKVDIGNSFYQAWPVPSLIDTKWNILLRPLFEILLKSEVILTTCNNWVVPSVPCFISQSCALPKVVETTLTFLKIMLAKVPDSVTEVFEFMKLQVTELQPSFLRAKLQTCPKFFFDELSSSDRLNLLRYCLSDNQNNNRHGELASIYLLPLANEQFIAFETQTDADHVYLCSPDFPGKLLPRLDHKLIDLHEADPDLQDKLMLVARSHKTQLQVLDAVSVANLLAEAMPSKWRNATQVTFCDVQFQFSWFEIFWKWVKDKDLNLFRNKHVLPIETTSTEAQKHSVATLSKDHPVLYIPIHVNCSKDVLSAISKLGIQYSCQTNFRFVDHSQLASYVKIYSDKAILETLPLQNDYGSIVFSTEEAECLVNVFARISLPSKYHSVLQGLRIFSTCVNTSNRLHSPSEVEQLSGSVVVQPYHTIDLSSLPPEIIVFSSENSNQALLLKKLGYVKSSGVEFILSVILPKVCSMEDRYIDGIMTQVLDLYPSLCSSNKSITTTIQKLPFVKTDSGSRKYPTELFDPDNKCIRVIYFEEREKFPCQPYCNDNYLSILKRCGLRNSLSEQEVLCAISSVGLRATDDPQPVCMAERSRSVGIMQYIASNKFSPTFLSTLRQYSTEYNWIPVLSERPSSYPSSLPWKGEDYSSHFVSLKGPVCMSSTSSSTLPLLYGSQVFFACIEILKWDEPVHCLVPHLKEVIEAHEDLEPEEIMTILEKIYFALQELVDSITCHHLDQLKSLQNWVYIKKHHRFVNISKVALKRNSTFDHDIEPYMYVLPDSVSQYTKLFIFCGMEEEISVSSIITILGIIKEEKSHLTLKAGTSSEETDAWRIVIAILNWLTDYGTRSYDGSQCSAPIYVPVESDSGIFDLREASDVVYVDSKFLKNTSESKGLAYVHEKISQNVAESLHIVPLSEKLEISEDIFEDAGQSVSLIVRLKNILSENRDGLPIIKELIQNADDANATEVKICYDRRSHTIDQGMLFFPGMCTAHGPALIVYNNSTFKDEDFVDIQRLAEGTKRNDHTKIGKFGTGFCSVYHITDVPSFVSRDRLYIFDPTLKHLDDAVKNKARPGKKVNFLAKFFSQSKQLQPYEGLFDFDSKSEYEGTMFRLPFRTSDSELSRKLYTDADARKLLDSIKECGDHLLLFLRHVKSISVYHFDEGENCPKLYFKLHKSEGPCFPYCSEASVVITETTEGEADHVSHTKRNWLVVDHETTLNERFAVASVASLLLDGSNNCYSVHTELPGEVFCFLPLSHLTGLPFHVSCNFALMSNRQGLWISTKNVEASDSVEIQWNTNLMENVIPMACMRLLNSLKNMFENDTLLNYKFYSLWPVHSNLKQHNPWSDFVNQLYRDLSASKLFFSESRAEWKNLKNSVILEPCILSNAKTPESVLEVLCHLQVAVVDLPMPYQQHLPLNDSLFTEFSFIDLFFSELPSLNDLCGSRNGVIQLVLELYASNCDKDSKICHTLKERLGNAACIPCSPDGIKLKQVKALIHPKAPFIELYDPVESMTLSEDLAQSGLAVLSLINLGIIYKVMPWKYVIERAQTIQELVKTNSEKAFRRIDLIIETIAYHTEEYLLSMSPCIGSINFLPVMKKLDDFPLSWPGNKVEFCSGRELLRFNPLHIDIAGSKSLLLDEMKLQKAGECLIDKRTEELLGLQTSPPLSNIVDHFELLIESASGIALDWIDRSCEHIYEFIDLVLKDEKCGSSESLERLKQLQCIWTGKTFINPDQVSLKWFLNGPHLHRVPDILSNRKSLCSFLDIKESFSSADITKAMLKMKKDSDGQPVDEPSQEIIRCSLTLLDDHEDDFSGIILPDKNYSLHEAEDLAYNDAPWASEEDSYNFVHESVPRELAKKLGVKPVRAKFLEKFTSEFALGKRNIEGVSFGQREELTQRIQNILRDYILDVTFLKELIQNADDAKASTVYFILDKRFHDPEGVLSDEWEDLQGPSLLVWNDSVFSDADLYGIQNLGLGGKQSESETIGQFGIGFNVVYHITDCPSFVTNNETFCIMDPHCRYVPGANKISPGRMFVNIGSDFWSHFPGMKSPYMRGGNVDNLPPEILKGSLFRLPLRHSQRKVKPSEIVDRDQGNSNNDVDPDELGDRLCAWIKEIKEAMLFLNHITELKLLVIEKQSTELKTIFHYKTKIEDSSSSTRSAFQGNLSTFKDGGSCNPCAIMYSLDFTEVESNGEEMNEKWLIQQSVGDINNSNQMWQFVNLLKPRHGLATPLVSARVESEVKGQVFSFLPLPIQSGLPIHVNGHFILDSARKDLWSMQSVDKFTRWNINLFSALSSSYAELLFQAKAHYVSKDYDNIDTALRDTERYYSFYPKSSSCKDRWHTMACNVYKCLIEKDCDVLCGLKSKPDGQGFTVEWYHPRSSKPVHYCNPRNYRDNHKGIFPILEKIGMKVIPLSGDVTDCFNATLKEFKVQTLLQLNRQTIFYYYTKCSSFSEQLMRPTAISETVFQDVETFVFFTKFLLDEDVSIQLSSECIYPSSPFSCFLLLTADGFLRKFQKVLISSFSHIFPKSLECFLHPDLLGLRYADSYFIKPDDDAKITILRIMDYHFPKELKSATMVTDALAVITKDQLLSLWNCFSEDAVFNACMEEVLKQWAILLTVDNKLFSTSNNILPVEMHSDSQIYQVMMKLKMPVLNIKIVVAKTRCPKLHEGERILSNLYHINCSNPIHSLLEKRDFDAIIHYLSNSVRMFNSDSLKHVTSLPLFETIDGQFTHIWNRNAYVWPSDCCPVAYQSWQDGHDAVFINERGIWAKLGNAKDLSMLVVNAEEIYVKFIFPHFHKMNAKERYQHLDYIRINIFKRMKASSQIPLDESSPQDIIDQKKRAALFIEGLNALECIGEESSSLNSISAYCDHTVKIFEKFSTHFSFLPDLYQKDAKWLPFLRDLGLRQTVSEEKYVELCQVTANMGDNNEDFSDIQVCSSVLLNYLFENKERWSSITYRRVSAIEFVLQEKLPSLAWAMPGICPDKLMVRLDGAASLKIASLLWTVKPIVNVPLQAEKHEDLAHVLGVSLAPTVDEVIDNIDNICNKSNFAQQDLFLTDYPRELTCSKKHESLVKIMCDNFTYLRNCETSDDEQNLSSFNFHHLKSLPCIPVYHTIIERVRTPSQVVLVKPNSVIYALWNSIEEFHPFLHCLPTELRSVIDFLKDIGVTNQLELKHLRMILEDVFNKFQEKELDHSASECVRLTITKLNKICSEDCEKDITPLYLPDIENKMRQSNFLLYDDKGGTKLDLAGTQFFQFNDIALELYEVLPNSVKPVSLTTVCDEVVSDDICTIDDSILASQLRKTMNFSELHDGIFKLICKKLLLQTTDDCFKNMIKSCFCKFKIISVKKFNTQFVLKDDKKIIGERKVSLFIASGEDTSNLYLENFEEYEMSTKADEVYLEVASYLSKRLCQLIEKSMAEETQVQLCQAVYTCLGKTSSNAIKKTFKKHYDIEVEGDSMPSLSGKEGEELPDEWHHRLDQDIANSFKPTEYVAYEDKEGHFIVARIAYQIKPHNEVEFQNLYRIYTTEGTKGAKNVNVLNLYKFMKCSNSNSAEENKIVSSKTKIQEQLNMLMKMSSDMRDPLFRKAIKRLFLKWYPEKNTDCAQEAAENVFTYFIMQVQNAEKHEPFEDPLKKEICTPKSFYDCWDRSSMYYRDFCLWKKIAIQHNYSMKKEKACFADYSSSECGKEGLEISVEVSGFPFDSIEAEMKPEEGKLWIKQAEAEFKILEFLHKQASVCCGYSYVCFMAQQLARKAMIGGVYALCGLNEEELRENSLSELAHILESFPSKKTKGVLHHCHFLEQFDQNLFGAAELSESTSESSANADQAKGHAEAVIEIVRSIMLH